MFEEQGAHRLHLSQKADASLACEGRRAAVGFLRAIVEVAFFGWGEACVWAARRFASGAVAFVAIAVTWR